MEKKRRKTVVIPDEPPRHDAVPLAVWAGDEDDEAEQDLAKLLAPLGYAAPPRRWWIRLWPWR
jgi:hypothetical protein